MDEIVNLLWKRDESALDQMILEHGSFCRQLASRFLRNFEDVEEVLNDVWYQIWNGIPPAKPKYFKAYLAKAVRNTAIHYIEKNTAQKRSGITVLLDELAECIPDTSTEHGIEAVFLKDILNRFVRSLHSKERIYFVRRYYYGEDLKEIARANDSTENQVAVTLYRSRQKLKKLLQKEDYMI